MQPSGGTPGPRAGLAEEGVGVGVQEALEPGHLVCVLLPGALSVPGPALSRQVDVAG